MKQLDFLTFSELLKIIEIDTTENNYLTAADLLLTAMTDWPTEDLEKSSDIVVQLKKEIKKKLTFDNLDKYSKMLTLDKNAWKVEAISSLLEMFDFERKGIFDKTIELETIIDRLTKHYRIKK